jgi:speckle-type POZ protein
MNVCLKKEVSGSKKWKLLDNKKLTIVVRLDLIEKTKLPPPVNAMSTQYEKLFNNEKFSDFVLITSDEKQIPVHKNILSIRSPVFETMMETKMLESKEGRAKIDDIDGKALMEFLRFVYCGRVEGIDDVAAELIYAASKYDLPDLKPLCVASMTSKLTMDNAIDTMMLADLHGENQLKKFCIDYVKW